MTLILSPIPFPDYQDQEPLTPLAGGNYNGGNNRPPIAAGQPHGNDAEDFARRILIIAHTLASHRQARRESENA